MGLSFLILIVILNALTVPGTLGQVDPQFSRSGSFLSFNPPRPCIDDTYDCTFRFGPAASIENRNISALFQSYPQFTFSDPSKVLQSPAQFTIELWVRIRDFRLLNGNSGQRPPSDRHIPLIGNLQAREGSGYELSCQRRNSVLACCLRLFTTAQAAVSEVCVDVSALANDWIFISGSLASGGLIKVRAFSPYFVSPITNSLLVSGTIRTAVSVVSQGSLAMRVGMQIPYLDNGMLLRGFAEFFTGDLDEIRIWRTTGFGDGYELETAVAADHSNLFLYIPVQFLSPRSPSTIFTDSASNSVVRDVGSSVRGPTQFNSKPAAGSSVAAALATTSAGLAWNISISSSTTAACVLTPSVFYVQPAWEQTCFVNYIDHRVEAVLSGASTLLSSLDGPSVVAAVSPTWRINFAQLQPGSVARVILRKANWRDTVTAASTQVLLINSVDLSINSGLPFSQLELGISPSNPFQAVLPASAAALISPGATGSVLASEPGCSCTSTTAPCNCLQLQVTLANVGKSCSNTLCPDGLLGQPGLRLLCLDWWVPRARGWFISAAVTQNSRLYNSLAGSNFAETMQALMGYEASPEWVGREEVPYMSAFTCSAVSYLQDIGISDGLLYVVVPGSEMVALLRARDRNLGDAVDIQPLDDPGLPNGARLCPSLFYDASDPRSTCDPQTLAPSSKYQTTACPSDVSFDPRFGTMPTYRGPLGLKPTCLKDGDRLFAVPQVKESAPRFWDRSLLFSPAPEQAGRLYALKFVAASYPSPSCAGQDWQVGSSCGTPVAGSFPPAGGYPHDSEQSRTYRSLQILVPTSLVRFDPPTPAEGTEQLFVAGCAFSTIHLFVSGSSNTSAAAGAPPSKVVLVGRYSFFVAPDPARPPPAGVSLVLVSTIESPDGATSLQYRVGWAPPLDTSGGGAAGCFLASDTGGVSSARRCFVFRRDKCRYCLTADESLESVGRRFGVDWLQIYMANPRLRTPDRVPVNTVLNVGVSYAVRPGDTLAALARRFAEPEDRIRDHNSDVDWAGGGGRLQAGSLLCIVPRVCDMPCLYGTDCYIY